MMRCTSCGGSHVPAIISLCKRCEMSVCPGCMSGDGMICEKCVAAIASLAWASYATQGFNWHQTMDWTPEHGEMPSPLFGGVVHFTNYGEWYISLRAARVPGENTYGFRVFMKYASKDMNLAIGGLRPHIYRSEEKAKEWAEYWAKKTLSPYPWYVVLPERSE